MAPFTFVGVVGPTYAGSELLSWSVDDGCVIVLIGHCTRNDCARAGNASRTKRTAGKPREIDGRLNICVQAEDLNASPAATSSGRFIGSPPWRAYRVRAETRVLRPRERVLCQNPAGQFVALS